MSELRVGGHTPLTTIDYPDHLSTVIYCQGCSWQCRYCHNPELIPTKCTNSIEWSSILNFLEKRRGLLEAVVFSGGEPLMQVGLAAAMQEVKAMGFKVGLHTGGAVPSRLDKLIPMLDWVGFDVKGLPGSSDKIIQVEGASQKNWQSLKLLIDNNIKISCRTTVHWQLFTNTQLLDLTQYLKELGIVEFNLQFCRSQKMLDPSLGPSLIEPSALQALKRQLIKIMPSIGFVAA